MLDILPAYLMNAKKICGNRKSRFWYLEPTRVKNALFVEVASNKPVGTFSL